MTSSQLIASTKTTFKQNHILGGCEFCVFVCDSTVQSLVRSTTLLLSDFKHTSRCEEFIVVLTSIFLMTNDIKHLFMGLEHVSIFFGEMPTQVLCLF